MIDPTQNHWSFLLNRQMLKASEDDLAQGRTISHEALNEMDRQWLGTA